MSTEPSPHRAEPDVHVQFTDVDGATARYTGGGHGPVVVFLHGWGLGHHAYRRGLRRLAVAGFRVIAPALPGFGATPDLAIGGRTFAGYAAWVARFVESIDLGPFVVVGHSFGGGVAAQLCADRPDLVRGLVMMNAVGGSWKSQRGVQHQMSQRPLWDWGRSIPKDVLALFGAAGSTMPNVLEDLIPNVVRNPFGVAKVGRLARAADLRDQFAVIRSRRLPVAVVHSEGDAVIPKTSFDHVCQDLAVEGQLVPGNHSWPLTAPQMFADIVASFIRDEIGAVVPRGLSPADHEMR